MKLCKNNVIIIANTKLDYLNMPVLRQAIMSATKMAEVN
jgi:hypothetical protein